jgi:hypothetical protein
MSNANPAGPRDACPRCGKPSGVTFWHLMPSNQRNRTLTCKACGGHYDLSDHSKMASILGALAGMAVGMVFPFQWIVKAGHGSKLSAFSGISVAAVCVGLGAAIAARLALRLVSKP